MIEAKSRVREHARNISRSSAREATASSGVYVYLLSCYMFATP